MSVYDWDKIFNNPAFKAIRETQKLFAKFDYPVNKLSQITKISEFVNSPAVQVMKNQQSLYNAVFPFEQTLSAIEKLGISKQTVTQIPSFQSKFPEVQSVLRPSNAFLSIIESNAAFRVFNNSGIVDAISAISKNMSAITALNRLTALFPFVEPIDNNVIFSEDGTILVDDVTISKDEIMEIAQEFQTLPLDDSIVSKKIEKIKSKKGCVLLNIIGIILFQLFLAPVVDDSLDVAREYLGINKILEKIDIKRWADEIFNNNSVGAVQTLSKANFPSMVVILTSLSTSYSFSPELEIDGVLFNMAGIPYCPPRTPRDREFLEEMKELCYSQIYEAVKTNYSIILLNNTPLTLQVLNELRNKTDYPNASDWLILSFFHNEEILSANKTKVTDTEYLNPQVLIDDRNRDFDSLSGYPFIKKVFIPYGHQITIENLKNLFEEN
jgi:hypothetical protein